MCKWTPLTAFSGQSVSEDNNINWRNQLCVNKHWFQCLVCISEDHRLNWISELSINEHCQRQPPHTTAIPVELYEHQVPDLQDVRVIHVDQFAGVSASDAIVVYFWTGAARTNLPHLPEVVLHVKRHDALWRNAVQGKTERTLVMDRSSGVQNAIFCTWYILPEFTSFFYSLSVSCDKKKWNVYI